MSADVFVYLDIVQFSKNGFQNRNRIKSANGPCWLTLPVKHCFGQSIFDTKLADRKALNRNLKTISANYAQAEGYYRWRDELQTLLYDEIESLCEIAIASTEWMLDKLGIKSRRVRASQISGANGRSSELISSICSSLQATSYLSGSGALRYMELDDFSRIGCEVLVQQWNSFVYHQQFPQVGFVPGLSTLDLLLNCPEDAAELIGHAGSWSVLSEVA